MTGSWVGSLQALAPTAAVSVLLGGAALVLLSPHHRLSWGLALLAALAALFATLAAGWRVLVLGGSEASGVDGVAAFAAPLVLGAAVLTLLMDGARDDTSRAGGFSAALHLVGAAGWIGALYAPGWLGLVIGVQVGWLAAASLTAMRGERGALNGALRLVTAGGAGAALMLIGAALISRSVGESLGDAANAAVDAPQTAALGFALLVAPLLIAAGAAPLHGWASAAYGRSEAGPVLLTASLASAALVARVGGHAATAPVVAESVSAVLVVTGLASVIIGSLQAIGAVNMRRLVAYAGAAQVGCILVAVALESPAGVAAALVLLFAWGAGAFALLGGAAATSGATLAALDGLGRRAPLAGIAITAGALSFMGAPLTIGFLGRWRLIEAGVGAGWWWATGAAVIASLAAVFYGGRLIERLYFRRASEAIALDQARWRWLRTPVLATATAAIAYGVAPDMLLQLSARAAELALGLAE